MIVFRLAKLKYSEDLLGKGAEKSGGRWNSKGNAMLYTRASRALCATEIAVHIPLGILPKDYSIATIEFPETIKILKLDPKKLPKDWRSFPHPNSTQLIGDTFISENKYLIMQVPSAVVQGDYNFLINPNHKDFSKIKLLKVGAFAFDERLFIR